MANKSSRKPIINRDQLKEIDAEPGLANNINNIIQRILHHNHPCFPHVGSSPQRAIEYWKPKLMTAALSGEHKRDLFSGSLVYVSCGLAVCFR